MLGLWHRHNQRYTIPESCKWKLQISSNLCNWRMAFDNQNIEGAKSGITQCILMVSKEYLILPTLLQAQFNIQIPYPCILMRCNCTHHSLPQFLSTESAVCPQIVVPCVCDCLSYTIIIYPKGRRSVSFVSKMECKPLFLVWFIDCQ